MYPVIFFVLAVIGSLEANNEVYIRASNSSTSVDGLSLRASSRTQWSVHYADAPWSHPISSSGIIAAIVVKDLKRIVFVNASEVDCYTFDGKRKWSFVVGGEGMLGGIVASKGLLAFSDMYTVTSGADRIEDEPRFLRSSAHLWCFDIKSGRRQWVKKIAEIGVPIGPLPGGNAAMLYLNHPYRAVPPSSRQFSLRVLDIAGHSPVATFELPQKVSRLFADDLYCQGVSSWKSFQGKSYTGYVIRGSGAGAIHVRFFSLYKSATYSADGQHWVRLRRKG